MKKIFSLSFPALLLALAGCGPDAPPPPSPPVPAEPAAPVLRLAVAANGEITADGLPVTLEQLADRLAGLKRAGGTVWYHRADPDADPHPNAMKAIELIAGKKLPIRLSSKPDFSDVADGKNSTR